MPISSLCILLVHPAVLLLNTWTVCWCKMLYDVTLDQKRASPGPADQCKCKHPGNLSGKKYSMPFPFLHELVRV